MNTLATARSSGSKIHLLVIIFCVHALARSVSGNSQKLPAKGTDSSKAADPGISDLASENSADVSSSDKRFIDSISGDVFKKSLDKKFIDSISGDVFKKSLDKKFIDSISGDVFKKSLDKKFIDSISGDIFKKSTDKGFIDSISGDVFKKSSDKRFIDSISGDIFKKRSDKRFIDSISGDVFRKRFLGSWPEVYGPSRTGPMGQASSPESDMDANNNDYASAESGIASGSSSHDYDYMTDTTGSRPLDSDEAGEYPNQHPRVSTKNVKVFKFNDSFNKNIPQSQIKYMDQKRILDDVGSSLLKRHLDDLGSSLLKREDKRNLDDLGSSLLKRHLDDLGSSLLKREDKRYLDDLGSSLIKREDKRYLDDLGSSLIKREDKRYLDDLGSSLIKREDKRYLDDLGSSLIKREDKRYLDDLGSSLIKRDDKRNLDDLGSSLLKRHLDDLGSSLIKREDKRYLDDLGSSLIKKSTYETTYGKQNMNNLHDGVQTHNVKSPNAGLTLENNHALEASDGGQVNPEKRHLDHLGSSLIKKRNAGEAVSGLASDKNNEKRAHEVTDDVLNGSISPGKMTSDTTSAHNSKDKAGPAALQ